MLRLVGYGLLTAGFLAAAYASVMDGAQGHVNWTLFAPSLAASVLGVVLARSQARTRSRDESRVTANVANLEASITRIVERLDDLNRRRDDIFVYDLRAEIDESFPAPIDDFVAGRESLVHRFGMDVYADVMSHFAAGERSLNRVWCCSADGYIDEAHTYLDRAAAEFRAVATRLDELRAPAS